MIDLCSRDAARYACEHWHYSGTLPSGKLVHFGVWEERFVGAVVYGNGSGGVLLSAGRVELEADQACELGRVALRQHRAFVSEIVAETLRQLKSVNPGLRLVLSYADAAEGHRGGIYQAGNWVYLGTGGSRQQVWLNGRWRHDRNLGTYRQRAELEGRKTEYDEWQRLLPRRVVPLKFLYAWPFDKQIRRRLSKLALPYPTTSDIAEEVSRARQKRSTFQGQVQSLHSAPT